MTTFLWIENALFNSEDIYRRWIDLSGGAYQATLLPQRPGQCHCYDIGNLSSDSILQFNESSSSAVQCSDPFQDWPDAGRLFIKMSYDQRYPGAQIYFAKESFNFN